ncbi:LacI family DNA-binding transcriptional regulator [Actomonas aquatica]|uniref:LacI family DNA-binding transcriptional regulator n=1 Tax=Actomonas aquatica TaxID=2866162 RepID=A0ABZ1C2A6_9BACT|nr:LacI family DNA-binding transcriptional regulator [Opitutus sp. WL0086]WRQ85827.1 LacI family DNA-binding transcriptional regulator [Opitutus sp. WL0086]
MNFCSKLIGITTMASINQEALAQALNLSRTTVSRSLSNHPAISAETRERVQAKAEEMGYRTSTGGPIRRRRSNKPLNIGVLIGMPRNNLGMATFPAVLQGIRERAAVDQITVDVVSQDPETFQPNSGHQPLFRHIRSGDWRGLILIYPFAPDAVETLARKISTVSVLTEYDHLPVDTVDTDHSDIINLIGRLARRGHRRIGFITWDYTVCGRWASRRFAAYAEGIFQYGLEFNPAWTANVHTDRERLTTAEAVADFAAHQTREAGVTAWACAADHQAYQLISDLHARGLEVPRDCSVTGFDGIEPPPGLPQLTTLRVAHADVGGSAAARLLNRVLHPTAPRRKILVETSLVVGTTVAAPPARAASPAP